MSFGIDITEPLFYVCQFKITRKCIDNDGVYDKKHMVCDNQCVYCNKALTKMVKNKNRKMLKLCIYNISSKCCVLNDEKFFKKSTKMCLPCSKEYYQKWKIAKEDLLKSSDENIKPQPPARLL